MVRPHLKILWHGEDNSARERRGRQKRGGKITSNNGQEWSLAVPRGQRNTGKGGKVLLQRHLQSPDDRQG